MAFSKALPILQCAFCECRICRRCAHDYRKYQYPFQKQAKCQEMTKRERGESDQKMCLHPMVPKPNMVQKNCQQGHGSDHEIAAADGSTEAEAEVKNLCAVLYGQNDIRMEETLLPPYNDYSLLISTECVGLSKSDISFINTGRYGEYVLEHPIILGHEAAGTVIEVGAKITNFAPGDRVAIETIVPCRRCQCCKCGKFNLCENLRMCGISPVNGALSRYFSWPAEYCLRLPNNVSFEEAALLEPLAMAHHACQRGGVTAGSSVLICGAGSRGLMAMQCAKNFGATNVTITDTSCEKLDHAKSVGADVVQLVKSNKTDDDLAEIKKLMPQTRPHVTFACCDCPHILKVAAELTRPGGNIVMVGTDLPSACYSSQCVSKEIDVKGVWNYCNNYSCALELLSTGRFDLSKTMSHHLPLEEIGQAINLVKNDNCLKVMIHTNPCWKDEQPACQS